MKNSFKHIALIIVVGHGSACSDTKFTNGSKRVQEVEVISPTTQSTDGKGTLDPQNNLPSSTSATVTPQPEPQENAFIGGASAKFRLGNGSLDANSNCYTQVIENELNGEAYLFEFELVKGPADVSVVLNHVCGVDVLGSKINLHGASGESNSFFQQSLRGTGTTAVTRFESPIVKLDKGKYTIRVESGHGGLLDIDDFIVGGIEVKSNLKAVVSGEAKAYKRSVKPTELSAVQITATTAVIKWKYPQDTDILGFKVCFKVAGSYDEENCSSPDVDRNLREKTLSGLQPNTDYFVKVSGFNKAFLGYYGQIVDATNTVQSFRTLAQ